MDIEKIIDHPLVSSMLFYPRKIPIPGETDPNIKVLKFKISKDILIGGFLYLNNYDYPTILLFHGNGEIAADYQYSIDIFFRCGVNLAVVDYRGYGFSSDVPKYTSLIKDALPIYNQFYDWMIKNNFIDSLFILGRSLGSICASEIGSHNPEKLRGIIFESGFAKNYDFMSFMIRETGFEVSAESLKKYSNDIRISKINKPVLVIHGTNDRIIPMYQGEMIYDTLPDNVEKNLILIEGAGHNDIILFKEKYLTPLKEFIQNYK